MDFQNEHDSILKIIEEVKQAVSLSSPDTGGEKKPLSVEDMEALLGKTQELIDKLNDQANGIAEKLGMTREELNKYIENPENFNAEDWKSIEEMQKQVEQFQKSLMQTMLSQKNEELVEKERKEQKKQKLTGRRNWMPM